MEKKQIEKMENIKKLIEVAIVCQSPLQDKSVKCPECGQGIRFMEAKEIERQDKTGWSMKFIGSCLHAWRIIVFPIGNNAFEGSFKYKGQTYELIATSPKTPEAPTQ